MPYKLYRKLNENGDIEELPLDGGGTDLSEEQVDFIKNEYLKSLNELQLEDIEGTRLNGIYYAVSNDTVSVSGTKTTEGTFLQNLGYSSCKASIQYTAKVFNDPSLDTAYIAVDVVDSSLQWIATYFPTPSVSFTTPSNAAFFQIRVGVESSEKVNKTFPILIKEGTEIPEEFSKFYGDILHQVDLDTHNDNTLNSHKGLIKFIDNQKEIVYKEASNSVNELKLLNTSPTTENGVTWYVKDNCLYFKGETGNKTNVNLILDEPFSIPYTNPLVYTGKVFGYTSGIYSSVLMKTNDPRPTMIYSFPNNGATFTTQGYFVSSFRITNLNPATTGDEWKVLKFSVVNGEQPTEFPEVHWNSITHEDDLADYAKTSDIPSGDSLVSAEDRTNWDSKASISDLENLNYYKTTSNLTETDLNNVVEAGNYGVASSCTNLPNGATEGTLFVGLEAHQLFIDSSDLMYTRSKVDETWTEWISYSPYSISHKDTRSNNQTPTWYLTYYGKKTVWEFKECWSIGITGEFYVVLMTNIPWNESSGGMPTQIAYAPNGDIYTRSSSNATTWSSWGKVIVATNNAISVDTINGATKGNALVKQDTGTGNICVGSELQKTIIKTKEARPKAHVNGDNTQEVDVALLSDVPTSLSQLSEDATHRVVSDTEKTTWNGKVSQADLDEVYENMNNKADKTELNNYMPKSGGTFTQEVKFYEVDGQCINFDTGIYINKTNGSTLIGTNGTDSWVGMPNTNTKIRGNSTRPTYNGTDIALLTDIPTDYVTTNTSQTITGYKKHTSIGVDTINGATKGNAIMRQNADTGNVIIGSNIQALRLTTKEARPKVAVSGADSLNESNYVDLALKSDVLPRHFLSGDSGRTSGAYTYYKLASFPTDDSSNSCSLIINGRIGGCNKGNKGSLSMILSNRDGVDGIGTILGNADTSLTDLVVYTSGSTSSGSTATLYIKTYSWFAFDLTLGLVNGSTDVWDGVGSTTTPSGTLAWSLSSAKSKFLKVADDGSCNVSYATKSWMLDGFASRPGSQTWGNQTGTYIFGMDDSTGGSLAFRRDNPGGGQLSMILDGTVYVNEGNDRVATQNQLGTQVTYSLSGTTLTITTK